MTLRPYQEQAIQAARAAVAQGHRRILLVSPTGTGKTRILSAIAKSCVARGGSVHWYAHRRELIDQARAECPEAEVISTQAAVRNPRPSPTLQIFDEAHHYVATEWATLLSPTATIVGATATPERGDGIGLGEAFDHLIPVISIAEATAQGHLVPCTVHAPEEQLRKNQLAQYPWAAYRQFAPGEPAIVFAPTVDVASDIAEGFRNAGIRARHIHYETKDRDEVIAQFKSGEIQVLVNVFILTEGFDHPPTSVCILARGCGSAGTYLQMVGRVLRPAEGKTRAVLIDLRGVRHVHGDPATERIYSLDGIGIRQDKPEDEERFCEVCGSLMVEGECEDCGPKSILDPEPQQILNVQMKIFARDICAADTPETMVQRLSRWMREAEAKQFKPGQAMWRFKSVYGRWPTYQEKQLAARI